MKKNTLTIAGILAATLIFCVALESPAKAGYPVAVSTVTPSVVGYSAEPAGLFGFRTRYRPVVAPVVTTQVVNAVPVAPAPVVTSRVVTPAPVVSTPVTVARPVDVARPAVVAPVYYAPAPVVTTPIVTYAY